MLYHYIILLCLITEIQNENIVFSDDNEEFDDTDKDPIFDPYCTIVEHSDDDVPEYEVVGEVFRRTEEVVEEQVVDEVSLNTGINQINIYNGRSKKGRKRKYAEQSRRNIKLLKNSNLSYYNYKNKKINSKIFKDFDCECRMKCMHKVTLEQRKVEFDNF